MDMRTDHCTIKKTTTPGNINGVFGAFRISGNGLFPAFCDGDVICHGKPSDQHPTSSAPHIVAHESGFRVWLGGALRMPFLWVAKITVILKLPPPH